jgi:isopentenyl phosphate kinase
MWRDLISGNYENYALLSDDDPYEECYQWFWCSINMDETYPKEFLDYLHQLVEDIDTGKEKTYSLDEVMKELQDSLESDHFAFQMDLDGVGYSYKQKSDDDTQREESTSEET